MGIFGIQISIIFLVYILPKANLASSKTLTGFVKLVSIRVLIWCVITGTLMIQRKERVVWETQAYDPTYRGNSSDQAVLRQHELGGVLP
jgi:hypothetical protein